jgi:4'-phosphopantetheinyl transferase EntD
MPMPERSGWRCDRSDQATAVIRQLLSPGIAAEERFSDIGGARLFPAEEAVLSGAPAWRRAEFATGRACARAALAALGLPAVPILPGPRGEPQWPAGVAGSITHCAGYRACAAARLADLAAIGIDAEPDYPLPDGLLEDVAVPAERGWLADRMAAAPEVRWDTLLFSAKESAYKAWFPLTGRPLRFQDAAVTLRPGGFTVLVEGAAAAGRLPPALKGSWMAGRGLVITAVTVPA